MAARSHFESPCFASILITTLSKNWDIAWFDGPISIKLLKEMHNYQRTNHYPGIYNLARKNFLGRHLMKMNKLLADEYDFFPKTYMLPHDYKSFVEDVK